MHVVLLKSTGIFTSVQSYVCTKALCQAEGWQAEQSLCSLLFILLLKQMSDFSASLWTSFLRKIFSVAFFFRFWTCFWSGSEFPHPSPRQCCLSLSPNVTEALGRAWLRLQQLQFFPGVNTKVHFGAWDRFLLRAQINLQTIMMNLGTQTLKTVCT